MISEAPRTSSADPEDIIRILQNELAETNLEVLLLTVELDKRVQERTAELCAAQQELRQKNAELQKRAGQLEALNKELETFSYSVSHDLRAPLRHINGYIQALVEDSTSSLSQDSSQFIDAISRSAERMGALIDDLLSFSRMSRTTMSETRFDMDQLLNEVIQEMSVDTKNRNIQWDIGSMPSVQADRALLKQVWANLLSNAVKYTRPRDPARITVGARELNREWEFFVRDNGVGFDMRYADKLFGVFQRLHAPEDFEGTGIGLANVRQIIRRHGGQTRAESKPDEGATFYFSLPKTEPYQRPSSEPGFPGSANRIGRSQE